MIKTLTTAALLLLPTATTAQPYSESMADCASMFQNAAQWVPSDDQSKQLMVLAARWHTAAVQQTATEGRPINDAGMWQKIDAKTEALEAKGATYLMSDEFNDWSSYCRSFAKHVKVSYAPN